MPTLTTLLRSPIAGCLGSPIKWRSHSQALLEWHKRKGYWGYLHAVMHAACCSRGPAVRSSALYNSREILFILKGKIRVEWRHFSVTVGLAISKQCNQPCNPWYPFWVGSTREYRSILVVPGCCQCADTSVSSLGRGWKAHLFPTSLF